jgi:hypothetical protein
VKSTVEARDFQMTELSGTLEGVGLPAVVRFLSALNKTGCLRIAQDEWHCELVFEAGQVTGARLGSRTGLAALEAVVHVLPNGRFSFDGAAQPDDQPNISLNAEALQAYLEQLASSIQQGSKLPALDAVPMLASQEDQSPGEEPLPLDRNTLQTLLAIDGRRTVREIIAQRGSLDVLWQLSDLRAVNLVRLESSSANAPRAHEDRTAPHAVERLTETTQPQIAASPQAQDRAAESPNPKRSAYPPIGARFAQTANSARRADPPSTKRPSPWASAPRTSTAPRTIETPIAPTTLQDTAAASLPVPCPRLGFEDDPNNSFGRPTRLHRCFATGGPLPLSLDQQRELCLSDQYGTCPRLTGGSDAARATQPSEPTTSSGAPPPQPESDDGRILRPPFAQRATAWNRGAVTDRRAVGGAEPNRLGGLSPSPGLGAAARPTPLRARIERAPAEPVPAAVVEVPVAPVHEQARAEAEAARPLPASEPDERRLVSLPRPLVLGVGGVVIVVLAVIGYLVLPRLSGLFSDEIVDPVTLPNSSAIAAGTPISAINLPRPTPGTVTNGASASTGASAASGAAAPAQPTLPPQPDKTALPQPETAAGSILDERFTTNTRSWPSSPQGSAMLTDGSYRLTPRAAGQFVAIGAPLVDVPHDVSVTADFQKLGGPAGGGYGIIVRDQGSGPLDGTIQNGRFYVLEAGDKGDVGIWRRDGDHWVDLLPWQHADAVKTGNAPNELTVRAVGNRLSLSINGTEVATRTDATFAGGNVGLFVGGDGNQVAVSHFSIQTP